MRSAPYSLIELYGGSADGIAIVAINLIINGEPRSFTGPLTVADLLVALNLDIRKVAVERNLEIVPRSTYSDVAVAEGDRYEIVRFIGGG